LRLNRLPPVEPPVTDRNTKNSSCLPGSAVGAIGNVWLDHTAVPPVETRFPVAMIGPVIES
jgi:hypothetical protein